MTQQRDWTTLFILGGLAAAVALGGWAALGSAAVEDLRERIRVQQKHLAEAEKIRVELIRMRPPAERPSGPIPGDNIALISRVAGDNRIAGTKLKGIHSIPPVERGGFIEAGYAIELSEIGRKDLVGFLVGVELERPTLRTKEIHVRKFTPEGDISSASVQFAVYEKKSP